MPSPLVAATDLIARNTPVRIVDCRWYLGEPDRGRAAYADGHLPDAVYASLDDDLSGPDGAGRHPLPSPEAFGMTLGRLGIGPTTSVVVYDDRGGAVASRLWWMLTDQGHEDVAVLDGGLQAWLSAGGRLTTEEPRHGDRPYPTRPWDGVIEIDAVASREDHMHVLDARSADRFRGEHEPVDPRAGHIPGALSLPLSENLDDELRFLPASSLAERFAQAGITDGTVTISQCGSGVTACHNILAMEIAGLGRPALYVGSWSDWSTSGMPIATGDA